MADTLKLAYFVVMKEGASYLGGLLLTDTSGIPLDFRYTEPITPTKLQTVLYGRALEPHLKGEIIQKTLLKELKTPPDLLLLPASELAGGWSGEARCPVLSVQKTQEPSLAKAGEVFRASSRELLVQVTEGASPLRAIFASFVDLPSQDLAAQKLLEAGYQMDVTEPLERVMSALQALVQPD
ncbi:MAG TPA: hypothetical protein PKM35_02535 [Holophaga sp.]|nr:hypothetical protein [Holophaga sp.]HPS66810.1 hypothetical protein [Holophaga sp.]